MLDVQRLTKTVLVGPNKDQIESKVPSAFLVTLRSVESY